MMANDNEEEPIRPAVLPLKLEETVESTNITEKRRGLFRRKGAKIKSSQTKGTPTSESDSPFSLLAPRSFAEESRNPLVRQFSRVRDVYETEMEDSPRSGDSNTEPTPEDELKWHSPEYWRYKRHHLAKQFRFARKLFHNDLKYRFERTIARDLRDTLPPVEAADGVYKLRNDSLWSRRVVSLDNGSLVASANLDYTVTIYDLFANNRKICTLENFNSPVLALAWLGEDLLATGTADGSINTWSVRTGTLHTTEDSGTPSITALVSMDTTKFIAGSSDGTLILYRHEKGQEVKEERRKEDVHSGKIWRIASYRHEILSISEDRTSVLSIARTLKRIGRWRHKHAITACALGRNYIITASYDTIRIRRRGDEIQRVSIWRQMHTSSWVHSVALWDNDRLLSTGGDGQIVIYDLSAGIVTHRVFTPLASVWDSALLPRQRMAVCGPWHSASYVLDLHRFLTEERSPRSTIWSPSSWALPSSSRHIEFENNSTSNTPVSSPRVDNASSPTKRPVAFRTANNSIVGQTI